MNKALSALGVLCVIIAQNNYAMNCTQLIIRGNQAFNSGQLIEARNFFQLAAPAVSSQAEVTTFMQGITRIHTAQINRANQALLQNNLNDAAFAAVESLETAIQDSPEAQNGCELLKKISILYIAQGEQELNSNNPTHALETFKSAKKLAQVLIHATKQKPENYYTIEVFLGRAQEALSKLGIHPGENQNNAEICYREAARHGNTEGQFRLGAILLVFLKNSDLKTDPYYDDFIKKIMNEAEQNFKSVIETQIASPEFKALSLYHLGILYLSQSKREDAKNSFIAAANMGHYASMHNCAQMALQEGKTDKALEFFTAVAPYFKQSARALARLNRDLSQASTSQEQKPVHEKRAYSFVDGVLEDDQDIQEDRTTKKVREI